MSELLNQFADAVIPFMPPESVKSYKAAREAKKAREAEALATKNEECAKAIESLAQALRSHYPRHDIEAAMQAVSKAYTAALVVDPLEAA